MTMLFIIGIIIVLIIFACTGNWPGPSDFRRL